MADMTKTKIIETIEKFDESGKLVEKITREETKEENYKNSACKDYSHSKNFIPNECVLPFYV